MFNPIGGGGDSARTMNKRPFLHEKKVLEVPNFMTFLEVAGWFGPPALKQHPEALPY